jgi:hypothetical protein
MTRSDELANKGFEATLDSAPQGQRWADQEAVKSQSLIRVRFANTRGGVGDGTTRFLR